MPSSPDPNRAERLADIYARAERLRRRRRTRLGTGALLGSLAVFLVGLLVGTSLEVPHQLRTIGQPDVPSTTTTTGGLSTTTLPDRLADPEPGDRRSKTAPGEETVVPPATQRAESLPVTVPPTSEPEAAPATSTTLPSCRNSMDPACGPLWYEPPPVNSPMVVDVTFAPQRPRPGERVTFTVRVRDDGPVGPGNCVNHQRYGEVDETVSVCTASCVEERRFGPWDPPPPEQTRFQETFSHTYAEAGTYTATFAYNVGADCSFSPYRSTGEVSITVEVG